MNEQLTKFAAATHNQLFDADYKGGEWMIEAVETHETIEHFVAASKNWNESTAVKHGEIAGFKFAAWSKVQAVKGQPRRQMSVIDFGDVRFALDCDLTSY